MKEPTLNEKSERTQVALAKMQKRVGEWALANFEMNQSSQILVQATVESKTAAFVATGCLNSLAPLMGLMEELGELHESMDEASYFDSIGDFGIYLLDFCFRENVNLSQLVEITRPVVGITIADVVASLGRLYHCTLKRHQAIRGFDDDAKYIAHRDRAINDLYCQMNAITMAEHDRTFLSIIQNVFDEVVNKRDWKKLPENGIEA